MLKIWQMEKIFHYAILEDVMHLRCSGKPDVVLLENALVVYPEVKVTTKNGYSNYTYRVFITEQSGKEKYLDAKSQTEMEQIYDSIIEIIPHTVTQNDSAKQ